MEKSIWCWKCRDMFYKEARLNKHAEQCKGKRCRVCGQTGHLACGLKSYTIEEINARIQQKLRAGEKVQIVVCN